MPQQLGYQRAAWMLLSSDWVDASTAREYGLVLEVVPDARLLARTLDLAAVIAARSPASLAAVKRSLRAWRQGAIDAAVEAENAEFQALMATPGFAPADGRGAGG